MGSGIYILLAAVIGVLGSLAIWLFELERRRRGKLSEAATNWLAAMDSFALAVSTAPKFRSKAAKGVDRLQEKIDRYLPGLTGIQAWLYGPVDRPIKTSGGQLMDATTRLLRLAPKRLAEDLAQALDWLAEAPTRMGDSTFLDSWMNDVRPGITVALLREERSWWSSVRTRLRRPRLGRAGTSK